MSIVLNKPFLSELERKYVLETLDSNWLSSHGRHTIIFQEKFADYIGSKSALAVQSGTAGLHLALKALGVGPRDYVIIPNFSCGSTISSVVQCGAKPVVMDIDPQTYGLDATHLEIVFKKYRPKALQMVHVYGYPCRDTIRIIELCKKYSVFLVEDASEALGARLNGKRIGSFGDISVFSIRSEKMIGVGEGGVVLSDDPNLFEKIKSLASRSASFRNKDSPYWTRYFYDGEGYNYLLPHLLGAVARAQIERFDTEIFPQKKRVGELYREAFSKTTGIQLQKIIAGAESAFWLNTVLFNDLDKQAVQQIAQSLQERDIEIRSGFWPLSDMRAFNAEAFGTQEVGSLVFDKLLVLPSAFDIRREDISAIKELILANMPIKHPVAYNQVDLLQPPCS